MKPVLHRLEQISSGSLNTAVRTGVGFSLAFFLCCANTFQNIIRFNVDLLGHTMMGWTEMASSDRPWTFDFDRLLSYRLVFMNLPGGSVVFHILAISSHSKLKREGFTDAPFGHGRFDWKEERRQALVCEWEASSSQQTVVGLAPASDITLAMGLQREQSSIQPSRTRPACRHGPECKHRPIDCKEMRLD